MMTGLHILKKNDIDKPSRFQNFPKASVIALIDPSFPMPTNKQIKIMGFGFAALLVATNSIRAQTWAPTAAPSTNWVSVASSTDGTKLVAAASGGFVDQGSFWTFLPGPIFTSTNSGLAWQETTAPAQIWVSVVSSRDGTKLAAAAFKSLYISADAGATWTQATNAPGGFLTALASSADGSELIAAVNKGGIYVSTNSGVTWQPTSAPSSGLWNSIACSADGTKLLAAPLDDYMYVSTNSGATWTRAITSDFEWQAAGVSADGSTLVAAARFDYVNDEDEGPIFVSTNSGTSWFQSGAPFSTWETVSLTADGTRILASDGGGIYTSPDSGVTWLGNNTPNLDWTSVTSSGNGTELAAVAYGGGVYIPSLGIAFSPGEAVLSWPTNSINYILQRNFDLATPDWIDVTNQPTLNLTNLQYELIVAPTNGSDFYRLKTP